MLAEGLNDNKVKPIVIAGGKVGLYYVDKGPFSQDISREIEDKFGIHDMYIAQNPLNEEPNNLVVWVDSPKETIFFNKTTQKWSVAA